MSKAPVVDPKKLDVEPILLKASPEHEIIVKGLDLICVHGWTRNKRGDKNVGFCVIGALAEATTELGYSKKHFKQSMRIVAEEIYRVPLGPLSTMRPNGLIAEYNDQKAHVWSVRAVLREAAEHTP